MERRSVCWKQADALVSYIEEHGDLALGFPRSSDRTAEGRVQYRQAWDQCADAVNREGPPRNGKEWSKYWCELKCRVKAKIVSKMAAPLNDIEERVATLLRKSLEMEFSHQNKQNTRNSLPAKEDDPPQPSSSLVEQSPMFPGLLSAAERVKGRVMASQVKQYSPTAPLCCKQARAEGRKACLEELRARVGEKRARVVERHERMEERRARTEQLLAEAAMQRAEAGVVQAEAARTQAQALTNINRAFQHFVELASRFVHATTNE